MFFRANVQPRPMAGHQWLQRFQQPWSCEPQQLLVRVISSLWLHWPLFYMYSEEITTPPSLENPPCQKRCLINGCQRGEENPLGKALIRGTHRAQLQFLAMDVESTEEILMDVIMEVRKIFFELSKYFQNWQLGDKFGTCCANPAQPWDCGGYAGGKPALEHYRDGLFDKNGGPTETTWNRKFNS